jgi:hypothetical protein
VALYRRVAILCATPLRFDKLTIVPALALELLRLHRGEDGKTFWAKDRLPNLTVVANKLHEHHLVPEEIIQICRKVAALRNSVTHKQLLYGITTYASYNDKLLFDSDYAKKHFAPSDMPISGVNEETIEKLLEDVDHALTVLCQIREEAGRGPSLTGIGSEPFC